jgi:hypothetical protein
MIPLLPVLLELAPAGVRPTVMVHAGGEEVAIIAIIMGTLSGLFYPLIRAWARRLDGGATASAPALRGVEDRLDRIERSVEAVALEVERISEGQRFVTKLLAEKTPPQIPPATP